jgi:hypothetical protein
LKLFFAGLLPNDLFDVCACASLAISLQPMVCLGRVLCYRFGYFMFGFFRKNWLQCYGAVYFHCECYYFSSCLVFGVCDP